MATRFITVSIEIMHDKNLNANQKFLLAEIEQLTDLEKGCFASNQHFAELVGITKENVSKNLSGLEKMGYIKTEIKKGTRNNVRQISLIDSTRPPYQIDKTPLSNRQESKENIQTNIQTNKKNKQKEIACSSDAKQIADYLLANIRKEKPNFVIKDFKGWVRDIDLAMRKDKRSVTELKGCIDWIYNSKQGAFWIPNILSGKKLREKFDTMESQMTTRTKGRLYEQIQSSGLSANEIIDEQIRREMEQQR